MPIAELNICGTLQVNKCLINISKQAAAAHRAGPLSGAGHVGPGADNQVGSATRPCRLTRFCLYFDAGFGVAGK